MERIGDIIKRVVGQGGEITARHTDDIETMWYRIVDGVIGEHSYVVNVKGERLIIRVDNRCYITEIKRREEEILSRLQDSGWRNIKKIICRIG